MPVWLVALKEDFNRTPGDLGRSKLILTIGSASQSIVIVKQEFAVEVSKVGLPTYGRARVDSLYSLSLVVLSVFNGKGQSLEDTNAALLTAIGCAPITSAAQNRARSTGRAHNDTQKRTITELGQHVRLRQRWAKPHQRGED